MILRIQPVDGIMYLHREARREYTFLLKQFIQGQVPLAEVINLISSCF